MIIPFGRVLTAMITPFTDEGEVDHERVWRLARFLSDHGSDGLVVTGTTGESPTLSEKEKIATYRTVVEAVENKDTMVLAGTGTYDTAESVHLSQRAAEAGVDGLMAVTPYYSKPGQEGLARHFEAIADATDLPVLVYNIPGRTGRLIEIETLERLARHPRILATKDAVMDVDFTSGTVTRVPDLVVYSGQDSYTLPMMAVGAVGVISVISHLAGDEVAAMVAAAAEGDLGEARRLHHALLPLCEACFLESNPSPVKSAMSALWEPVGDPRLPLTPASDATLAAIEQAMRGLRPHVTAATT
ncbi:MAG TPA: 4-hydroxy-tetrahydrodipicolinate synthase [Acidimicrobiia bacterium]|nr:4-hydroxy-tetrahydrodipicolinate synthase [Acidimicrobiia bacterium]